MKPAARLVVATYNIHSCVGLDGRCDTARVAEVIRETDAGVIGLQEVGWADERSGQRTQADQLGRLTGLGVVHGPVLARTLHHSGNALLTALPVESVRHIDLGLPDREPRGALEARLVRSTHRLRVVVTHLGLNAAERRAQTARLLAALDETAADETTILLGDFNVWGPGSLVMRRLRARFGRAPRVASFPSRWPLLPLDRVWVSPQRALLRVIAHRSPLARVASDHLPVRGELDLDAPSARLTRGR
jgi:endonuclease/exonuclease/phosphatase family metal-dependent hydrolase